ALSHRCNELLNRLKHRVTCTAPALRLHHPLRLLFFFFFFFNHPATTEIYTLSLHDALPISGEPELHQRTEREMLDEARIGVEIQDRKSTRLNSSHLGISYAVFCLKKKKTKQEKLKKYSTLPPHKNPTIVYSLLSNLLHTLVT